MDNTQALKQINQGFEWEETFSKVVEAINSIKPFVEINRMKHEYWYRNQNSMRRHPLNPNDDDWFIRNLWDCSACECWWDEDSDDEDYEPSPVTEDWLKACPFKYEYGGTGDYYSVLIPMEYRKKWEQEH